MRPRTHRHDRLLEKTVLRLFPASITPNHLTLFRLITTPVVLVFLHIGQMKTALIVFVIIAFTDALDGSMARTRDQVSEWGTLWDPIADKVLIASVTAFLILDHFPLNLVLMVFITEAIFLLGGYLRKRKGIIVSANRWGKLKMIFQVLGVALFLLSLTTGWAVFATVSYGAFIVAIIFAIFSLIRHGI